MFALLASIVNTIKCSQNGGLNSTNMKALTVIILFTLFAVVAQAQRICGSEAYKQQLLQTNPSLQNSFDAVELQIAKATKKFAARDTTLNEVINIPVVIHVIYKTAAQNITDAQINSQLTALNNDFANLNADKAKRPGVFSGLAADVRIKFCLAQVDPQGKKTTGIVRKSTTVDLFTADDAMKSSLRGGNNSWDNKKYLNIWLCALTGRSLGYATPPGSNADIDGVVIAFDVFGTVGNLRASFNKGRTATHEVGHWMGLKHLWGDTDCGDDGIDDTPRQKTYNFGIPTFPNVTTCSPNANGDMFMNYMDFSDDAAMNMFTNDQKKRMRALFATGNIRNSFLSSFACDSNLAQAGPIPAVVVPVVVPVPVVKINQIKVYPNPVQNNLMIDNKNVSASNPQIIQIFNTVGVKVYNGSLTKENSNINLSQLTAGIYIVKIGENSNQFTTKLIKQ